MMFLLVSEEIVFFVNGRKVCYLYIDCEEIYDFEFKCMYVIYF